jgi:hypothetical protein
LHQSLLKSLIKWHKIPSGLEVEVNTRLSIDNTRLCFMRTLLCYGATFSVDMVLAYEKEILL